MDNIEEIYGSRIRLPNQPSGDLILNFELPRYRQKWVKKELPSFFDKVEFNKNGELILTNLQEDYANLELERIRNGIWIYINGLLRYFTGKYYFYLQYYTLEDGNAPDFREADRQYFLFHYYWHKIEWCYGIVRTKKRRAGASSQVCSNLLYEAIFYKNTNCGLVSKSSLDGKATFASMVVNSYRQLPIFLKPRQWNKEDSVSTLIFSHKAKKTEGSVSGQQNLDGNNSKIEWRAPAVNVFDSSKLNFVLVDEGGKMPIDVPLTKLLAIISKTLIRGVTRVGWIEMPSTTNDMKKGGGAEFYKVFKNADQFKKTPTTNRLIRFFQPAYVAFEGFIDEFGDSVIDAPTDEQYNYLVNRWVKKDEDGNIISELTEEDIKLGAKHYILNKKRDGLEGKDLEEEIRMNPVTEDEAFMNDGGDCPFNAVVIKKQQKYLENNQPYIRKIVFYRDLDQRIKWRDDDKGMWNILAFPTKDEENAFDIVDKKRTPKNTSKYVIGCDGISATQNSNYGKLFGSKAAAFIMNRDTMQYIAMYFGRAETKEKFHEQILMACEYYGCKVWIEKVADSYFDYYRERGKLSYLGKYPLSVIPSEKRYDNPERLYGFPITPFAMTAQLDKMVGYIEPNSAIGYSYCETIFFNELLEQLLVFENEDRTKSDCVIAGMITLCVALEPVAVQQKLREPLIPTYN